MKKLRWVLVAAITSLAIAVPTGVVGQQAGDKPANDAAKPDSAKRPRLSLRAHPTVGVAPARIVLTAELVGGTDDFEEYYCPSIEWDWGDDTVSESTVDCEPFESGKSEIKRRFTVQHVFRRAGAYKVYFHMKQKAKTIASASANIQVQPGGLSQPF
ncbi:MAG: hypothetical protein GEU82_09940 [Luteitalea sp.]|nr:hypothetical protein [Luteitalea sp.]